MASNIPITNGQGQSSVAAEEIGSLKYQQIKVVGGETGSTSVMGVNPDRSINVSIIGTVAVSGSIIASGNQSVSGTVGASIIGWVPIQPSNTSIITRWADSSVISVPVGSTIAVLQSSSIIAIVTGSVLAVGNTSVSGTVGASIIGWVPIQPSNTSIITRWADSSVLAVPVGSTVTVWQIPSVVGTYAEDAAHTTGEKGVFTLAVRNDTLASVTSADRDYSQVAVGPVGETITANAPITKWIRGTADLRVVLGASVTAVAAQGASIFTYITSAQVLNFGPSSVIVTFAGGLGSILGYTIAPAGGGSNIVYPNALKTGENSAFTASISGTASVIVSAQGFIASS